MWCLMCRGVVGSNPKYSRVLKKIWLGKADAAQPEWNEVSGSLVPHCWCFGVSFFVPEVSKASREGPACLSQFHITGAALFSCWATHTASLYPGSKGCSTGCRVISDAGGFCHPIGNIQAGAVGWAGWQMA